MRASTTSFSRAGTTSRSGSRGPIAVAHRGNAQRHHLAIDRRAHDLALDLVLRGAQAFLQLAHLGGGFLQLVGGLLLILVARLRDARFQLADALRASASSLRYSPTRAR